VLVGTHQGLQLTCNQLTDVQGRQECEALQGGSKSRTLQRGSHSAKTHIDATTSLGAHTPPLAPPT